MIPSTIQAVIFDMDGVLIDSEPVWQQAEYEVLRDLGLPLQRKDILETVGLRIDQVVDYWYRRLPWDNYDNGAVAAQIVDRVIAYIKNEGTPMAGVLEALACCKARGLKVGLATSSSWTIIDAVLDKLEIRHCFDAMESAEHLAYGKPHPEVYLNCATKLGVPARLCLAIEDSFNGLIAARAATMHTLAIPPAHERDQPRWVIAHERAETLTELPALLAGD
ncbi:hexitol phosphatase HxpB [Shewanella sedimentimangrovi]|uniref:Hexitol phosphatase HxpB n=1 Tax=Shewanella sedimentimangrovi TaxID=2814293 RepID=A0ABX7R243_9GAMM|nr:hexitol phosphatase HxpB [Shewanella sedimentimangrovi]QSX36906.1 hexitol phosphatase HxpB [Shewanella sedimentimangrovi]